MPSRNQRQISFLITLKKTTVSRGSFILLAGFLLLIAYLWVNESYPSAVRFFLFFCPHVFLFLSQDMFREEIESGALESVLFLDGRFRAYLRDKTLVLAAIGLSLNVALFLLLTACGIVIGEFRASFLLPFAVGILAGAYYLFVGGLLSFYLKGGSNVLAVILVQVLLLIAVFLSATQRTGLIDLLTANEIRGWSANVQFFLLSLLLPNLATTRRLPAVLAGLAVAAALLWLAESRKIARLEIAKR